MAAKRDEYKSEMLDLIIKIFTLKISEGNATDYSRLGWLLLNNNNQDEAKKMAEEGLKLDINNKYCNRLIEILE